MVNPIDQATVGDSMLVSRRSIMSGKVHELDLDITTEQISRWDAGGLIQDVMPHLTPEEREFLMTGITEEEWDEMNDDGS